MIVHLKIIKKYIRIIMGILFFTFLVLKTDSAYSKESISIPLESVSGRITAQDFFGWNYGYDIGLNDEELIINISIHLIPVGGVKGFELDRVKPLWKEGIERVWSRRFELVSANAKERYPIVFNVNFQGSEFHHEIAVYPSKSRRSNELNWNLMDSQKVIAHEFGHMLGLFDEYKGGATMLSEAAYDKSSIMRSGDKSHDRHYRRIHEWFVEKTGLNDFAIKAIYEK